MVKKKIYITGGIGSGPMDEAFGEDYQLPNQTSHNETCAAIANFYWNHCMFLLHGETKYIDVLQRTVYNGMLCGVSLSGDSFFYPTCMASDGKFEFNHGAATRQPWSDCACCPSNVIRFLPSVPDYIYAHRDDLLYINLFIANPLPGDLYRFLDENPKLVTLKVNSESQVLEIEKGFAILNRVWSKGDVIELNLRVLVRRVLAHERVEDDPN